MWCGTESKRHTTTHTQPVPMRDKNIAKFPIGIVNIAAHEFAAYLETRRQGIGEVSTYTEREGIERACLRLIAVCDDRCIR